MLLVKNDKKRGVKTGMYAQETEVFWFFSSAIPFFTKYMIAQGNAKVNTETAFFDIKLPFICCGFLTALCVRRNRSFPGRRSKVKITENQKNCKTVVIPSERSESRDLRMIVTVSLKSVRRSFDSTHKSSLFPVAQDDLRFLFMGLYSVDKAVHKPPGLVAGGQVLCP